jgi:hypothetical protein
LALEAQAKSSKVVKYSRKAKSDASIFFNELKGMAPITNG